MAEKPSNSKGGNGRKRNGHPRGTHPKSLANLKLGTPIKKGEHLPQTPRKPRGLVEHLKAYIGEGEVKRPDGRIVPRDRAVAELLVDRALRGLTELDLGEWDKSIDHVLGRLAPMPRDVIQETERRGVVQVNDNGVTLAFVERVRTHAGVADVGPAEVMEFLEQM